MKIPIENRTISSKVDIPIRFISSNLEVNKNILDISSNINTKKETALTCYNKKTDIINKSIYILDNVLVFSIKTFTELFLFIFLNINNWLDNYIFTRKYRSWFNFKLNKEKMIEIALKENKDHVSIQTIQNKYKISYNNAISIVEIIKKIKKVEIQKELSY